MSYCIFYINPFLKPKLDLALFLSFPRFLHCMLVLVWVLRMWSTMGRLTRLYFLFQTFGALSKWILKRTGAREQPCPKPLEMNTYNFLFLGHCCYWWHLKNIAIPKFFIGLEYVLDRNIIHTWEKWVKWSRNGDDLKNLNYLSIN